MNGRLQHLYALKIVVFGGLLPTLRIPTTQGVFKDDWRHHPFKIGSVAPSPLDIPTLFFSAAARNHKAVVEIGSAHGDRIIGIKLAVPEVEAFGMDIAWSYDPSITVDGVKFIRYTPREFDDIPDGTLVVARGTLAYFEPDELAEFLSAIRRKNMALAYFEPDAIFPHKNPIRRRVNGGYYHPYKTMTAKAGFQTALTSRWNFFGSFKRLERWEYDYCVPA